jgi:exopolysaccharide biosynthesis predicted pyruvyltransferase EpsI
MARGTRRREHIVIDRRDLLARRRAELVTVMESLIEPGTPCALLGWPRHANVGDSAIWIAQRQLLRQLGASVVYACDEQNLEPEQLRRRLDGGTILLSGGGNLGDLWPGCEDFRERVITSFPELRIVQLPQTICFRDAAALERSRRVFAAHSNITLLLRDHESVELARETFEATTLLCSDSALLLAVEEPRRPSQDLVWLARQDHERDVGFRPPADVPTVDWARDDRVPLVPWRVQLQGRGVVRRVREHLGRLAYYDAVAARRLERGLRLLRSGRVVVTDRLHGHILAFAAGIPHVLLDDAFSKAGRFHRLWTEGTPLVRKVDSVDAAVVAADELLAQAGAA